MRGDSLIDCHFEIATVAGDAGRRRIQTCRPSQAFRLQVHVRRGTGSNLPGAWSPYLTLDDARDAAREMLRSERVLRVTIVANTVPPRFVEWVNR
jgi:hypothetical protein